MKLGYAWISVDKPRGETPAPPPEKRAPALPPRRLAHGIGIGQPLASSRNWFGYLEGRFRPKSPFPATFERSSVKQSAILAGSSRKRRLALGKRLSERRLNAPYGGDMVNVRMLNCEPAFVPQPDFREIFRVLGRFPRFKNPVKYIRGWQINQFSPLPGASARYFLRIINHLRNLTNYQNTCANLAQDWKAAQVMQTRPTNWLNGGKLPPFSQTAPPLLSGAPSAARRRGGSARRSAWRSRRYGAPARHTQRAGPAATGRAPWRRVRAWPLGGAPQASAC